MLFTLLDKRNRPGHICWHSEELLHISMKAVQNRELRLSVWVPTFQLTRSSELYMPFFSQTPDTSVSSSVLTDIGGNQTNITGGVHIQFPNHSISKRSMFKLLPMFCDMVVEMD